jgi:hypothetical protein
MVRGIGLSRSEIESVLLGDLVMRRRMHRVEKSMYTTHKARYIDDRDRNNVFA